MTRKSAASVKAIKTDNASSLPSIEETFGNMKQQFVNTVETSVILAKRIDNLMNIRDYAYKFWGSKLDEMFIPNDRLGYLKDLRATSIKVYENILEIAKGFELDEFLKEDMKDYFEDLMPKVDEIKDEKELCVAGLVFLTVKPYGEKMTQMHHTMLDEKKQREFEE